MWSRSRLTASSGSCSASRPVEIESPSIAPEFETLVVTDGWLRCSHGRARVMLERDVLPAFLAQPALVSGQGQRRGHRQARRHHSAPGGELGLALALIEAKAGRDSGQYLMPLAINWTRFDRARHDPNALAAVRRGRARARCWMPPPMPRSSRCCSPRCAPPAPSRPMAAAGIFPAADFAQTELPAIEDVRAVNTEQSNTTVLVGSDYVVKLFRRLEPGINPEIEVGRFLTEMAGFANMPPLLGTVELVDGDARSAVAVVHRFIENQGDAWSVTSAYLDRYVEEQRLLTGEAADESDEQATYLLRMRQVGRRVAEMQIALASRDDVPDFSPSRSRPPTSATGPRSCCAGRNALSTSSRATGPMRSPRTRR